MNTEFATTLGQIYRNQEQKIFDWDQAARILKERRPVSAMAGLQYDMEWTGGTIYEAGHPVLDDYTYLASTWATPILCIDGDEIPCFLMAHETKWNCDTKWPQSALDILNQ